MISNDPHLLDILACFVCLALLSFFDLSFDPATEPKADQPANATSSPTAVTEANSPSEKSSSTQAIDVDESHAFFGRKFVEGLTRTLSDDFRKFIDEEARVVKKTV
jgi:hypothetical protein